MEDQNTSGPLRNIFPKKRAIVFRGIMQGIIGGVTVGMMLGVIYGLFKTLDYVSRYASHLSSLVLYTRIFVGMGRMIFNAVFGFGLPIGFVIGLSTGILAASFGHHCPNLILWLALSWVGAITGFLLGVFRFYGWPSYWALLAITLSSLAASGMAYQATIQEIRKSVPKAVSQVYTFLSSLSHVLLIFIMLCPFFFLTSMST